MKTGILWLAAVLIGFSVSTCNAQSSNNEGQVQVSGKGESALVETVNGKSVRVVLSAYEIEIGKSEPSAMEQKTNCTYGRHPCSQVSNLSIWVGKRRLLIPRSVFADCADVGAMWMTSQGETYVLGLGGGDGAEAYTVKIYFDSHEIKRREVFDGETKKLLQTTTYMPPQVVE